MQSVRTDILQHYNFILKAALYFTRNQNDQALDLVQETFYKALRYADRFQEGTNLKGWLYTILRRTFFNLVEYNNHRHRDRFKLDKHIEDPNPTPESILSHKEIWQKVESFQELAMYLNGYDYQEISSVIGRPIGTTKSRIFKARQQLQILAR